MGGLWILYFLLYAPLLFYFLRDKSMHAPLSLPLFQGWITDVLSLSVSFSRAFCLHCDYRQGWGWGWGLK